MQGQSIQRDLSFRKMQKCWESIPLCHHLSFQSGWLRYDTMEALLGTPGVEKDESQWVPMTSFLLFVSLFYLCLFVLYFYFIIFLSFYPFFFSFNAILMLYFASVMSFELLVLKVWSLNKASLPWVSDIPEHVFVPELKTLCYCGVVHVSECVGVCHLTLNPLPIWAYICARFKPLSFCQRLSLIFLPGLCLNLLLFLSKVWACFFAISDCVAPFQSAPKSVSHSGFQHYLLVVSPGLNPSTWAWIRLTVWIATCSFACAWHESDTVCLGLNWGEPNPQSLPEREHVSFLILTVLVS